MQRVVFLDRDGTINVDTGYLRDPDEVELIPGAASAISKAQSLGYKVVVVSNQSGIGRGLATKNDVERVNQRVSQALAKEDHDSIIDYYFYSPDAPQNPTSLRKPDTGMYELARESLGEINIAGSWMLGDKLADVEFGLNIGLSQQQVILLLTGHGEEHKQSVAEKYPEVRIFDSIAQFTELIV